jgi:hypothetical protein
MHLGRPIPQGPTSTGETTATQYAGKARRPPETRSDEIHCDAPPRAPASPVPQPGERANERGLQSPEPAVAHWIADGGIKVQRWPVDGAAYNGPAYWEFNGRGLIEIAEELHHRS